MKSFLLLVFFICFVQICMSASIKNEIDEISSHQNEWKADPDVNQQAVDDLVKIFDNFKKNSQVDKGTMDLLNIVLNKGVAEDKHVKLQITDKSSKSNDDDSSDEKIVLLDGVPLPIEDLSELERVLTSKLNESQKTRALELFRGIRGIDHREFQNAMTNLMKDAILATLGDKYTFKDNKVVLKAANENQN